MWKVKSFLKGWVPPVILQWRDRWNGVRFSGDYRNWEDAAAGGGYDAESILKNVKASTVRVLNGEAVYEQDSQAFDRESFNEPLLCGLLLAAASADGRLRVVDFGGSLGSVFFQHRRMLAELREVRWCVVEQPHYVDAAETLAMPDGLRFYRELEPALAEIAPNVILFASVLQYLPDYLPVLRMTLESKAEFILIDRTPLLPGTERCRIVRQTVPARLYAANYPARMIGELRLLEAFEADYRLLNRYRHPVAIRLKGEPGAIGYEGLLFRRRESGKDRGLS